MAGEASPPRKLLVVEDEPIIALDLSERLQRLGYDVVGRAETAHEAIDLARRHAPDLVLMDIRLRGQETGVDAAKSLRDAGGTPVLFVTAHGDPRTVAETRDAGAFGLLLKPFDDDRLRTSVEIALHAGDANRKLRASELRYSLTLRSIGDAVLAADAAARITFLNPAAEKITGWSRAEALGKPLVEVFRLEAEADGRPCADEFLLRILHGGQARLPEGTLLVRRDGGRVPIEDSASVMIDEQGEMAGFVVAFVDTTERRRISAERDAYFRKMRAIFECMPVGCVVNGPDFVTTDWNPACERLFGFQASEVIGKTPYETIIPPADHPYVREIETRLRSGDIAAHGRNSNITKDGRIIQCEWTNTPLFDEAGRVTGSLSMVQDVTDRVQREQRLVESERMFKAAFDEAPHGMLMVEVGEPARVRLANQAVAVMLGWSVEELCRSSVKELTHPDDFASQRGTMAAFHRGELPLFRVEKRYRKRDGTWLWVDMSATLVRDAQGAPLFALGHVIDLTGRRAAEEQRSRTLETLSRSERLRTLGMLAGGVAHDFNNLLGAIRSCASTAEAELERPEEVAAALKQIHAAAEMAGDLCRQLMQFAGQSRVVKERLDPRRVLESMSALLALAVRRPAKLLLELDQPAGTILGDAAALRQVALNLVSNASEAMEGRSGRVCVGLYDGEFDAATLKRAVLPDRDRPGTYVVLDVSDTGCGIDPAFLPRIFDPFVSSKGSARGMGLSTVLGIVRGHGGNVIVDSAPGVGTRFRVLFPPSEFGLDGGPGQRISSGAPQAAPGKGRSAGRLLVVDDDPLLLTSLAAWLTRRGFEIVPVADGAELERRCGEAEGPGGSGLVGADGAGGMAGTGGAGGAGAGGRGGWACAVVDLSVSVAPGMPAHRYLRRRYPALPLILMSGGDMTEFQAEVESNTALTTLSKPFNLAELLDRIGEVAHPEQ